MGGKLQAAAIHFGSFISWAFFSMPF